jgi:hypothetical protein
VNIERRKHIDSVGQKMLADSSYAEFIFMMYQLSFLSIFVSAIAAGVTFILLLLFAAFYAHADPAGYLIARFILFLIVALLIFFSTGGSANFKYGEYIQHWRKLVGDPTKSLMATRVKIEGKK